MKKKSFVHANALCYRLPIIQCSDSRVAALSSWVVAFTNTCSMMGFCISLSGVRHGKDQKAFALNSAGATCRF